MNEYWKSKLDSSRHKLYDSIVEAARHCKTLVRTESVEGISDVFVAVKSDHPEFFWLPHRVEFEIVERERHSVATVRFQNLYSKAQIEEYSRKIEDIVKGLREECGSSAADEAIERSILRFLLASVLYEVDDTYNQNAAAALCRHKAQCSGISSAFKLLADRLGLWCIVVYGEAREGFEKHTWNIVRLSGHYYHVDATFMLGCGNSIEDAEGKFLNFSDGRQHKTHIWDAITPPCSDASREQAIVAKNIFNSLYDLTQFLIEKKRIGEKSFVFELRGKFYSLNEKMTYLKRACERAIDECESVEIKISNELCFVEIL